MERIVSGIKPTGDIHLGNYFGAMKQFVELQNNYESYIFIADYHALNQINNPQVLQKNILEIAKAYLAVGLDPQMVVLFRQSDIPFHTELCWIFNSLTPIGLLKRAHAYKDAESKNESVNVGLFDYPVLMAADILIYDADVVPVGSDQKQHLEITQEISRIFNNTYGETFRLPKELISIESSIVKGTDGRKMSKSYNNVIGLFDSKEVLTKKIMSIVTDSKGPNEVKDPDTCNVFYFHNLISNDTSSLKQRYLNGTISYKEAKELLIEKMDQFISPIRMRKEKLDQNEKIVLDILNKGKSKALPLAEKKISEVRNKIGITLNF